MERNIKLKFEYDGTEFCGWQRQPNARTVQGKIENKLKQILGEDISLTGSGRTDAGVHALAQVANFKTESTLDLNSILKGLNSLLPEDILLKDIEEVDLDFNSRFRAKSRVYQYRIYLGKNVFLRRYVWEVFYNLDFEKIEQTARLIQGKHDFTSFCVAESSREENICEVQKAIWEKKMENLEFEIESNRFLHTMVRSLVGTMIDVGRGYFSLEDFKNILKSRDHKKAGLTAPAKGLYLVKVNY
ncbi:MAG: tRNA pseudouridine(38-40) synthase TruA [candidate division Zixibacteria bacterium]|nr:tRNA pseudouridine(38-40) synthase TruA [candidate division Zixibacteria bacterium]